VSQNFIYSADRNIEVYSLETLGTKTFVLKVELFCQCYQDVPLVIILRPALGESHIQPSIGARLGLNHGYL